MASEPTIDDLRQEYVRVLAEVKQRVAKFAEMDRLRGVRALESFMNRDGGPPVKLPDGKALTFEDLSSPNLRHFVLATVLVVAEHEMRVRDIENFLEEVQERVREMLTKAEDLIRASQKPSGAPN